jgi:hypothetical protein
VNRATAKPLVIAVTGFTSVITLILWFISFMEFDQLSRFGERPLSLPPFGHVLHVLYHPSWLLPVSAAVFGRRLLSTEQPPDSAVSRYCSFFVLAASIWALIAVFGLYSIYAMHHHFL